MTHISEHCTDRVFDLIAAVYSRALWEAKRGDPRAIEWLDTTCPDWRERYARRQGKRREVITEVN